jgi:hypothetical protein
MLSRGFAESTMTHPLAHQPSLDADGTEGARTRRARPAPAPGDTSKKKKGPCVSRATYETPRRLDADDTRNPPGPGPGPGHQTQTASRA